MQNELTPDNNIHNQLKKKIAELEKRIDLLRQALKRVREDHAEELDKAQRDCKAEMNILQKVIVKFREQKETTEHKWQLKLDELTKSRRSQLAEKTQIIFALQERLNVIREEHESELAEVIKNAAVENRCLQEIIIRMRAKIFELEKEQQ